MKAAVVGAGLIGRLLANELSRTGWQVTIVDRDDEAGRQSCTYTGAGMLAPYCELERAETIISELGLKSIALWPGILEGLVEPVGHHSQGSLMVAHPNDRAEFLRLRRAYRNRVPDPQALREVAGDDLAELEPELAGRFNDGLYFASEGQIDNQELLRSLAATLKARQVEWHTGVELQAVGPHRLTVDSEERSFDWVIDCRGLGAKHDLPDLRGVRGELLYVRAPEVELRRPVRLMHPRYPIYIVPRRDHVYLIGATSLESDDLSPIAVRSVLELLSAAYTVHPGFAEARLGETLVNCRPAFPDNLPRINHAPGLLRVNGLYRHGFLISPILVQYVCEFLRCGEIPAGAETLMASV